MNSSVLSKKDQKLQHDKQKGNRSKIIVFAEYVPWRKKLQTPPGTLGLQYIRAVTADARAVKKLWDSG